MFKALEKAKLAPPRNPRMKIPYELSVFAFGLGVSLPTSISIFPQIKALTVTDSLESEVRKNLPAGSQYVYFNKGL
jgi:hypothetical protein